jgi:agmatine deiminase
MSFFQLNDSLLGYQRYNILSNFEPYGIQHIDCFLKLIDEETILVAEPPVDHKLYSVYNDIVTKELSTLKTPYNKQYNILRIATDRYQEEHLAAYTNSLILNKTVYVPLFDIPQDSIALKTWSDVMPGYTIKGFTFALDDEPFVTEKLRKWYQDYGWRGFDALHCRTRAIWNPEMLFISVNRIEDEVKSNHNDKVYVTIIDYSKKGLVKNKCELFWRISRDTKWETVTLSSTENENHFFAQIPNHDSGTTIEYYISAVSNSGVKETKPMTAPFATYEFLIK